MAEWLLFYGITELQFPCETLRTLHEPSEQTQLEHRVHVEWVGDKPTIQQWSDEMGIEVKQLRLFEAEFKSLKDSFCNYLSDSEFPLLNAKKNKLMHHVLNSVVFVADSHLPKEPPTS